MANEKRLIDANALMDEFRNYMVERHDRIKCASEENCKVCENGCLWREVVSKAPTVDAVEVVHGRWGFGIVNHREYMKCSVCLKSQTPTGVFTYCPNCGAKMDGGNEDG